MGTGFGKFQQQTGEGLTDVSAGMSGFVRWFFYLIAGCIIVAAFVPFKSGIGSGKKDSNLTCGSSCPGGVGCVAGTCEGKGETPCVLQPCPDPDESCQNRQCKLVNPPPPTPEKTMHLWLLIPAAIFILLGYIIVPMSRKMQEISHKSPGAAQAIAGLTEAEWASDIARGFSGR